VPVTLERDPKVGWAVLSQGESLEKSTRTLPTATFERREAALLGAAFLPDTDRRLRYKLAFEPDDRGYASFKTARSSDTRSSSGKISLPRWTFSTRLRPRSATSRSSSSPEERTPLPLPSSSDCGRLGGVGTSSGRDPPPKGTYQGEDHGQDACLEFFGRLAEGSEELEVGGAQLVADALGHVVEGRSGGLLTRFGRSKGSCGGFTPVRFRRAAVRPLC